MLARSGSDDVNAVDEDDLRASQLMMDFNPDGTKDQSSYLLLTAVEQLTLKWRAEKSAPQILPFEYELCDQVSSGLEQALDSLQRSQKQVSSVSSSRSMSGSSSATVEMRMRMNELVELECERVRYLLKVYLRVRLEKIQRFARYLMTMHHHIQEQQEDSAELEDLVKERLSIPEQDFLNNFVRILERHYFKSTFEVLPVELHELVNEAMCVPDVNTPVFIRVKEDIGTIMLDDRLQLSMTANQIYFIRFTHIEDLLKQDKVELL